MLVSFLELISEQRRRRSVLAAFTCYDLETALGVLAAAESAGTPVVLLISNKAFAAPRGELLVAGLRGLAEQATTATCLQLDHVSDLSAIAAAFELGCGAVMADGSQLALEANIALSSQAAQIARRAGGSIEVELGHVSGEEDVAVAADAGMLTDPATVEGFVSQVGPACLAVSIGNVHGDSAAPLSLDWARLAAIRSATDTPLSLHGASGLQEEDARRAIMMGVTKVNVNTDLRKAYLEATGAELARGRQGWDLLELHNRQVEAVYTAAAEKLRAFVGEGA